MLLENLKEGPCIECEDIETREDADSWTSVLFSLNHQLWGETSSTRGSLWTLPPWLKWGECTDICLWTTRTVLLRAWFAIAVFRKPVCPLVCPGSSRSFKQLLVCPIACLWMGTLLCVFRQAAVSVPNSVPIEQLLFHAAASVPHSCISAEQLIFIEAGLCQSHNGSQQGQASDTMDSSEHY